MRLLVPLIAAGLLAGADPHDARGYRPPEFPEAENHLKVPFLPASRDWERIDVYVPKQAAEATLPCVVLYYGGGWGGKVAGHGTRMKELLARGYVVAMPDYVLGASEPVPMAIWDGAAAIRWLRANAQRYRIDPERIGCWGFSAGGWLAQYHAPSDDRTLFHFKPRQAAPFAVPMVEPRPADAPHSARVQAFATDWGAGRLTESPGRISAPWLTADDPPLFTCHNEQGVTPKGVELYAAAGCVAELQFIQVKNTHVPRGTTPVTAKDGSAITWDEANYRFFDEHVKAPRRATAPEIHPHGGPIAAATDVHLATLHAGARIHYTFDGSDPTASSPAYEKPLPVAPGTTLKAIAIRPGLAASAVAAAVFTPAPCPPPRISARELHLAAEVGKPFSATFAAESAKPVSWHLAGKIAGRPGGPIDPDADNSGKAAKVPPWLTIDGKTGELRGTPGTPGVSVFIVACNLREGGVVLADAVAVTVSAK